MLYVLYVLYVLYALCAVWPRTQRFVAQRRGFYKSSLCRVCGCGLGAAKIRARNAYPSPVR
ncbi:hypothetical protein [Microbulbifer aestuariivivens]|uniref:hypothetical protein n=1 Tax=Microbulbifer aestuariivivens TaxID=1908308 RepID=UPI0031EA59FD